jgi:flagellar export protein FliJ
VSRPKFRLERVLHARRAAERRQRAQLAVAENRAWSAESVALASSEAVRAARASVGEAQSATSLDASWIVVAQGAHARMTLVEERLHADAEVARGAAATERSAWRSLRADVRGLERLESRNKERLRERAAKVEERAIEEFAARRAEERRRNGARR